MTMTKLMTLMLFCGGMVLYAQTNGALSFSSASGEYVLVPYTDTLAPTAAITVECWLNTASFSTAPSIISKTEVGGYALYAAGTQLRFDIRVNGSYRTVSGEYAGKFNAWHHAAATFDGRYTRLYIDGTLTATDDLNTIYPIQYSYLNPLIIAGEASTSGASGGSLFNGSLDEVRIWGIARSPDSIQAAMNRPLAGTESGLIGYWPFEEGSGSTTTDKTTYHQNGTLVNTPTWIGSGPALPVELSSFSAEATDRGAVLRWNTATEVNNHGFEIQRKLKVKSEKEKGGEWAAVGFVAGNGTTNIAHAYTFIDVSASGSIVYRVKQIDHDGAVQYSAEREVAAAVPHELSLMQNFPNPFNPTTSITYRLDVAGPVTLSVHDLLGRTVAVLANGPQHAGEHTAMFDGTRLSSGTYLFRLHSGGRTITRRMLLIK